MKSYKLIETIKFSDDTISSLHQRSHIKRFLSLNDNIHVENVHVQFHDINDTKNSNRRILLHEIFINFEFFDLEHLFIITSNCLIDLIWCCFEFYIKKINAFFICTRLLMKSSYTMILIKEVLTLMIKIKNRRSSKVKNEKWRICWIEKNKSFRSTNFLIIFTSTLNLRISTSWAVNWFFKIAEMTKKNTIRDNILRNSFKRL
jgi:hypothetical protein